MSGPLHGIRILDLSRILAGPFATQFLGDLGADVIKIERPGTGDDTRTWGPPYIPAEDGSDMAESAYYLSANRNKRSVAVDIATSEGADVVRRLAGKCDVLVENFKPGGLRKYGLDHESMCQQCPELIYCSISGFGQTGPNAARPGYDLLAQAMSGIMAITGTPEGEPMKVGVGIADVMCGMYASNAIQAALLHRMKTGEGQHIDIALSDTTTSWLVNAGTNYLLGGVEERLGNQHPNIVPYQVFEVSDGHVIVAAGNDRQFARFCQILRRDDLSDDARFATNPARLENREALIPEVQQELRHWVKGALIARMEDAGVPGGPINTLSEVFDSDQVKARSMRIAMPFSGAKGGAVELIGNPVKFSATPVSYRRPPPQCGAHTEEVLNEFLGERAQEAEE